MAKKQGLDIKKEGSGNAGTTNTMPARRVFNTLTMNRLATAYCFIPVKW